MAAIDDPEVRREVASLLEHTGEGANIAGAIGAMASEVDVARDQRLGPYRLVRRLGQGGQNRRLQASLGSSGASILRSTGGAP